MERKSGHSFKESQLFKSVFRHGFAPTIRNRVLFVISNVFLHLHPVRVKRHGLKFKHTWCMGGITFFLFLVLTLTGILLMYYYHPDKANAYADMKFIEFDVPLGMLLRNMHRWGAHLMVLTVWLHMLRVFVTGSYKAPREFNWVIGVGLLLLTMMLSFTGYLLPDDQLGFWAVTVGTNMASFTPFVGHEGPFSELLGRTPYNDIRFALLGGSRVGGNALLRAYVWHCIGLPVIVMVLCCLHFWRVRKDGGISGPL